MSRRILALGAVAGLAVTLAAVLIGLAADDVLWGLAAWVVLGMLGAGLLLTILLQRRILRRTADVAKKVEALRRKQDDLGTKVAASSRQLGELAPQVKATATIAGRLTGPLDHGIALREDLLRVERHLFAQGRADTAQIESFLQLMHWAPPGALLPPSRGWAASADHLALLVDVMLRHRPALIVDVGSGLTTVWMALAARAHGLSTRIVALDHDADFARRTTDVLTRNDLQGIAEVRHAPLVPFGDAGAHWYDPAGYADLEGVGLVSVDGPPESTGDAARHPALPALAHALRPDVVIVLDDADRDGERIAVERWLAERPDLRAEHHTTEKGTVVLTAGHPADSRA